MPETMTPMVKQYQEIKSRHTDAILFFRLGDFYEMFNDDARTASKELELTLTGRGEGDGRMPMCGVPYHAAQNYISKLLNKGYKVAICDQVEDPKLAKGIVKRDVVKVITPGTVQDEKMLDSRSNNYLAAINFTKKGAGIAYVDASTGEFKLSLMVPYGEDRRLCDEIDRIHPSELLVPDILPKDAEELIDEISSGGFSVTRYKDIYDDEAAKDILAKKFGASFVDKFGLHERKETLGAAAAIIDYLNSTQKGGLDHINRIQTYSSSDFMFIDRQTIKNLELTNVIRDGAKNGSLLWVLDRTSTPMGGRLLRNWVLEPLLDTARMNARLDAVEELSSSAVKRGEISSKLGLVADMERVIARISSGSCNARDMVALKESLGYVPVLKDLLKGARSAKLKGISTLDGKKETIDLVGASIMDQPPNTLKDGGLIKAGYNRELDELKELSGGGKEWIKQLELSERTRTGIKSLKVGYTSVFGYYIEVSKSNLGMVPKEYIRKQTLVNCERFITPEMKEKEALILNAEEKINSMEYDIFSEIRTRVSEHTKGLQEISRALAELDALNALSDVAAANRYVRPSFSRSGEINVTEGRHPVVERTIGENKFVPNDIKMDHTDRRFLLITGPNMAGKSTYMRQTALICLMAQMGSFVPAKSAVLPVIDRIFTRIGAMDDIFSGQSTFMMEMTETANIINNATEKSLVILDEIGRGTSTFDGMSIAAAVAEHINDKIKAFTLFATHYHEITRMAEDHKGMKNLNTLVRKEGDSVIFLHRIVDGAADQSYGIEVAKLAGLPESVIERAKQVYDTLEMVEKGLSTKGRSSTASGKKDQIGLFTTGK